MKIKILYALTGIFILFGIFIWRPALLLRPDLMIGRAPVFQTENEREAYFEKTPSQNFALNLLAKIRKVRGKTPAPAPAPTSATTLAFVDDFNTDRVIQEAGSMTESGNTNWWVSSGGYAFSSNGKGTTVLGDLSLTDSWRLKFAISNPLDTDNGIHPQNIFRFVQRNLWTNLRQEAYFNITKLNLSDSPNRRESNGLLFFNRYQDAMTLYYTGIRVDGYSTIKKKINGTYYTLAYKSYFPGSTYNRDTNPNRLPVNQWIGMRSEVITNSDNTVTINLYLDEGRTGNWQLALSAIDDGKSYGGDAITKAGYAGIRTDFMDAQFDDYKISAL